MHCRGTKPGHALKSAPRRRFSIGGANASTTLSGGHAALIEEMYRYVYILATLKREDMLDARGGDLRHIVAEARRTMAETIEKGSA